MSFFDIILLTFIACFGLFGAWFGFVHTIGSLLGMVFGVYVAARYYEPFAYWMLQYVGFEVNTVRLIAFIVAFIIINRLVGFFFWVIDKVLSIITRLPFVHSLDRLLGFVFGLLEGTVTIGLAIFFIERFPLSLPFMQDLAVSQVAPVLSGMAGILWPLLPDAFRLLQSTVDYVANIVR